MRAHKFAFAVSVTSSRITPKYTNHAHSADPRRPAVTPALTGPDEAKYKPVQTPSGLDVDPQSRSPA